MDSSQFQFLVRTCAVIERYRYGQSLANSLRIGRENILLSLRGVLLLLSLESGILKEK